MEDGTPFATARKQIYQCSDQSEEVFDFLPPFREAFSSIRNPTVERTLSELRKVINAIIREMSAGLDEVNKPQMIRIELARDLKRSRKDRKQLTEQRDQNTKSREKAAKQIVLAKGLGESYATPHNILKVRLADECNWVCPYTGKQINKNMDNLILSPQFEIEHIIPYSRSLDNSYTNKTLCYHEENRHVKKNRTPYETYHDTENWEDILERVRHFQGKSASRKLKLFEAAELPESDDFISRQLNDTRYLSRAAADYLSLLYGGRTDQDGKLRVQASPGRLTAILRRAWELNRLGIGNPDEEHDKDRADHRHHAIDAFVVAVSSPSVVKKANEAAAKAESYYGRDLLSDMAPPWKGFTWQELGQSIEEIVISSRVDRKLNGRLHQDTILSKPYTIPDPKKPNSLKTVHNVRKPLERMSKGEVVDIVDPVVREAVITKLNAIGGEPKKAFADKNNHPYLVSKNGRLIPIHSARIRKPDKTIIVGKGSKQRHVCAGDNHHMEIVAVLDKQGKHKKWEGHIVSRFEAVARWRNQSPVIQKDHGPEREFVFSLTNGEHVLVPDEAGNERLLRVTVISGQQIEFVEHNDARPITIRKTIPGARIRMSVDRLRKERALKIAIDPLGKKWPAGD